MEYKRKEIPAKAIKIYVEVSGKEVGRAYLYLIHNGLHKEPYGYLEDVYVDESMRGAGIGTELLRRIFEEAKKNKCYKLVGTSRYSRLEVHEWYKRLGFKEHGIEFRMNFE